MAPARQRDEAREQWKLEEERAQSLQEDIERLALVRPEIEECQVSISGLQQSIQHNRDAGIDWLIEPAEDAFGRAREMLARNGIPSTPHPFDRPIPEDIDKAELIEITEEAQRALGKIGGSLNLALGVLESSS